MIELENFVTLKSVEYAYGRSIREQKRNNMAFADVGLNAARMRDPALLKVLDKAANLLQNEDDNQRGDTRHNSDIESERRYTTETNLWREAYRMVDEGKPERYLT